MNTGRKKRSNQVAHGVIKLKLRDLSQLFNSMDPSPFHEKDLDHDAEEFIVSWAQEFHSHAPLKLIVHLENPPPEGDADAIVREAIHNYFRYRADLAHREFKRLIARGRTSLIIGLLFLAACLGAADFAGTFRPNPLAQIVREGLVIAGWVAMWHPMQIFLYEWWPLMGKRRVYQRLAEMEVEVPTAQVPRSSQ